MSKELPVENPELAQDADAFEEVDSRFIVGIDLGTTNCAVAFVDTEAVKPQIQHFKVEQWVDFGVRERLDLLPSFHYEPQGNETESLGLTDAEENANYIVGALARDRGLQQAGRQVTSAKSWLCHAGVDRQGKILPWQADSGVTKLSPVDVSSRLLAQIRQGWNKHYKNYPLEQQDIVLTLPASFDQVARQLTIDAAKAAGLPRIILIEEPQAAFYAWLAKHEEDWEDKVEAGQTILVCDIGGGTTDFTLIRVKDHAPADNSESQINELHQGKLSLHRVAVGQHLILGGDNIDLALAKTTEQKINGSKGLSPRAWDALRQACRVAKETILAEKVDSYAIHLPGSGSKLIGGGIRTEITAEDVSACVLEGFFPKCDLLDRPINEVGGLQEFGLPYASDAAITKHLASFLWDQRDAGRDQVQTADEEAIRAAKPDWILFNGGVMSSKRLAARVLDRLHDWFAGKAGIDSKWTPGVLDGTRLDLAVAFGAAYFGQVKRGQGVEISANLARSFYLKTSAEPAQAICVTPGSADPGDTFRLDSFEMELAVGQPVQFPLLYSSTRLADRLGEVVQPEDEHFASLPPIRTVLELRSRKRQEKIPISLEMELNEIGTLQMWCVAKESGQRWKLEFDIRGTTQTDHDADELTANQAGILDEDTEQQAKQILDEVFGPSSKIKPSKVMRELTSRLELSKSEWPPSLLRSMWEKLTELDDAHACRKSSVAHEARWLNLVGFCLRPGYGMAADDWRVAQTWKRVHGKLAFSDLSSRNESLILWRRIAGGFTAGQQLTVYQQIAGPLRNTLDPRKKGSGSGVTPAELIELLRLVGGLELLPVEEKIQVGDWLLPMLNSAKWKTCHPAALWTLGRLGAREPTYGPLNGLLPAKTVQGWIKSLLATPIEDANFDLALMMCARLTGDRYRDIDAAVRQEVLSLLKNRNAPVLYQELVESGGQLDKESVQKVLGDALPIGIQLKATVTA